MFDLTILPLSAWQPTLVSFGMLFTAVMVGFLIYGILFHLFELYGHRYGFLILDYRLVQSWRGPARLILPLLMVVLVTPWLLLNAPIIAFINHVLSVLFIMGGAWLLVNSLMALQEIVLSRYDVVVKNNLKARAVHTQLNVLVRVLVVIIIIVAFALMLMTFERIRQVGVSILASAGVIGIIFGVAAQKSIATMLAGVQIAVAQPIRLDDVVIVEGEWGIIEEIALTYVVVKLWDLRRLVVPVTYFLEKPFQNWTRSSAKLLGTVLIYGDYTVPVTEVRKALEEIVQHAPFWNREVCALQVTNINEQTVELRALVSADDAGSLWELRCHVRENLLRILQEQYPQTLPKIRAVVEPQCSE